MTAWNAAPPRVLFVDDEIAMSRATGRLLSVMGFDVITVGSPLEAMTLAHDEHIDVVVLDINLPKFSGVELAHELRAAGVGAPILFISGDPGALESAGAAGFDNVRKLAKPFSAAQLNAMIWEMIRGSEASRSESPGSPPERLPSGR